MSTCGYSHPLGPEAWPVIDAQADIKTCNQDFSVDEILDFEPSGDGEHLYLHVQKDGENTPFVGRALARVFGVAYGAVSYAGMKDRHACTQQWFSIHLPLAAGASPDELTLDKLQGEGLENVSLIEYTRHLKKLRRGQIKKNKFVIVLRALCGERHILEQRLKHISEYGYPNYFGEQRFGNDNLDLALKWMAVRRSRKISGFKKGLHISVLRSFLFNRVLSARIQDGSWNSVIAGDYVDQDSPTGTLWGRGSFLADLDARKIEESAVAPYVQVVDALEHVGLMKEQRRLVAIPENMEWKFSADTLRLNFALAKGEYATSMLREVMQIRDANPYAIRNTTAGAEQS